MLEDVGTSANDIIQLDSNAKIPAVDGSLLTGTDTALSASSDPTISTNPTNGVGTKYRNTTSGEMYICTDATAGANVWKNVGAGSGNIEAAWYGGRGIWGGGESNASPATINTIDYVTIGTTGNATDFGDLTEARNGLSACGGGGGRGVFLGGSNPTVPAAGPDTKNIIDYITVASTGNAIDFGDLTVARKYTGSCSNGIRGLLGPGNLLTPHTVYNTIDYVTLSTTGNATDFGDATVARYQTGSCGNATRGVFAGGGSPSSNVIDYVTIGTAGNATDFGDMLVAKSGPAGLASDTRGVFAGGGGGGAQNVIQYITIASVGNATDFGNLLSAQEGKSGCSNGVRGVYGGGYPPVYNNIVEYITIASTGNSVDFGDLTAARTHAGSCSQ